MLRLRTLLVVAVCSGLFQVARADLPLPDDLEYLKRVDVQFLGIDNYREYVFQVRYLTAANSPRGIPYRTQVIPSSGLHPVEVERRILDFQLLAIKRDAYRKLPKEKNGLAELTAKTEGVLCADVPPPETIAKKARLTTPVHQCTVEIKDGKLIVTLIERKAAGWMPIVGGLFLSCALMLVGLRFAKYVWRKAPGDLGLVVTLESSPPA